MRTVENPPVSMRDWRKEEAEEWGTPGGDKTNSEALTRVLYIKYINCKLHTKLYAALQYNVNL